MLFPLTHEFDDKAPLETRINLVETVKIMILGNYFGFLGICKMSKFRHIF